MYLLVVDYFSRYVYPKIAKLMNTASKGVIAALQPIFVRYGIPEIIRSDNGPQYAWCGLSPAQLLMGRRIRSTMPQILEKLLPNWPYIFKDF